MFAGFRNATRLIGIIRTLGRNDALFPLDFLRVPPELLLFAKAFRPLRAGKKVVHRRPGQRLATALQEMGPSFIKLGQTLATRSDLTGEEFAADLSELQDRLPPFPGAEARATVEAELGRPLDELFSEFNDAPVAAASIAQVHLAVTSDGVPVAVKVLRPRIEAAFGRDLDLFYWLAEVVERTRPALRRLKPVEVVRMLESGVRIEMDLRMEAAAASELRDNFADDPDFRVPKVDWGRTGRRVLTLERIEGIRIDERDRLIEAGHNPEAVLAKTSAAFFRQAFRDGFFHADLHPGNIFVDAQGRIAVVDFGIMGRLDKKTRYYLADMLQGFLNADYERVAEIHFRAGYVPANQSVDLFTQACRAIGEPIFGKPQHEISIARLLSQLFELTENFEMETQPQLLLLQKTMLVAEGVGRCLSPNVNMWQLARPLIEDWMIKNRGPEARLRDTAADFLSGIEQLPALVRNGERALKQIGEGGLRLHPETIRDLRREAPKPGIAAWIPWLAVAALVILLAIAIQI